MLDFFKTISAFVFAGIAVRKDALPIDRSPPDAGSSAMPQTSPVRLAVELQAKAQSVTVTIPSERLTSAVAMQRLMKAASAFEPVAARIGVLNRAAHDDFNDAEAMLAEIQRDLAVLMGEAPSTAPTVAWVAVPIVSEPVATVRKQAGKLAA